MTENLEHRLSDAFDSVTTRARQPEDVWHEQPWRPVPDRHSLRSTLIFAAAVALTCAIALKLLDDRYSVQTDIQAPGSVALELAAEAPVATPGTGPSLTASGDGQVWASGFRESDRAGVVVAIAPTTGETSYEFRLEGPVHAIEFGYGSLWVLTATEAGSTRSAATLFRIDPASHQVVGALALPGGIGLSVGLDAVWVASPRTSSILRIEPMSMEVEATIDLPNQGVIEASGSRIWVPYGGELLQIHPSNLRVDRSSRTAKTLLGNAIVASSDRVWVSAKRGSRHMVLEYDRAGTVVAKSLVAARVDAMAIDRTGVWASTAATRVKDRMIFIRVDTGLSIPVNLSANVHAAALSISGNALFAADQNAGVVTKLGHPS